VRLNQKKILENSGGDAMNFPPGYRELPTFRTFARISGLEHPLENIFTFYSSMQVSKRRTFLAEDGEAFLDLLDVREPKITGDQIRNALLKSQMVEETQVPGEYYAKEFSEFNRGLFSARENGKKGGNKKRNNLRTNQEEEPTNEVEKSINEGRNESTNERMNGRVPHGIPTGNPPVTHGFGSSPKSSDTSPKISHPEDIFRICDEEGWTASEVHPSDYESIRARDYVPFG